MELHDALMTTRAMRRLSDQPVSDATIQRILRAAVQAPSGGNIQPYQFLVATDQEVKDQLAAIYLKAHERYEPAIQQYIPPFKDEAAERRHQRNWAATDHLARNLAAVPAMVLVLVPKISMAIDDDEGTMDVGPVYASVYPAVQNLILAARNEGLGTVLTTVFRIYEDEVREVCGIPERFEVVALMPLGVPTGKWGVASRRPAESMTSWNQFGDKRAAIEE
ncbi:MAG: oxidoreductase [Actinomycetia bacterium]|nr:oxidoreductase [Actinomycetes bacterium]